MIMDAERSHSRLAASAYLLSLISGFVAFLYFYFLPGSRRRRLELFHYLGNQGKVKVKPSRLSNIKRLSNTVVRIMGLNPGSFTLQGSNTFLCGTGGERVLIDTGEGKKGYDKLLSSVLTSENAELTKVIITHKHFDHTGGLQQIRRMFPKVKVYKYKEFHEETDCDGGQYINLRDGDGIYVEGASIRVIHTPGHTQDHIALYLKEDNAIFTGDCVLGQGTAVFEDLHTYMQSLHILHDEIVHAEEANERPVQLYPGHGTVVKNGREHIEQYIEHRLFREKQLLKILKQNPEVSLAEAVESIYGEQKLNFMVKAAASRTLRQHFEKLEKDQVVRLIQKDLWSLKKFK